MRDDDALNKKNFFLSSHLIFLLNEIRKKAQRSKNNKLNVGKKNVKGLKIEHSERAEANIILYNLPSNCLLLLMTIWWLYLLLFTC